MAYQIRYFRRGTIVWETSWTLDIPPSCRLVRSNLAIHDAERAIILDDNGFELIIEERQRFDA